MKFMASLRINWKHFCGGCLISWRHVLTAGQCIVYMVSKTKPSFYGANVMLGGMAHEIKDFHVNNKFNPLKIKMTRAFDIGLILVGLFSKPKSTKSSQNQF